MSTKRPSKIVPRPGDVAPSRRDAKGLAGNFRDRDLLDLAHDINECTLQLPGVCTGYSPHGCEPAHSNFSIHGKGARIKAHDNFHAASCHACHAELDQGRRFTYEQKMEYFVRAHERTMLEYFRRGWVGVTAEGRRVK
ncbi:hypothetical protein [Uliginosibacterium sediminicola]|uniref:DUF1364 domain-containing protein n=1 Tax=Uliginosibacterium sediminicola TaxID=2024550 RepID=A0ABU9YW82_9RHOO